MNGPCWLPRWELRTTNSLVKQEALSCPGASGVRRQEECRELAKSQGPRQLHARGRSDQGRLVAGAVCSPFRHWGHVFVFSAIEVTPGTMEGNDESVPEDRACL